MVAAQKSKVQTNKMESCEVNDRRKTMMDSFIVCGWTHCCWLIQIVFTSYCSARRIPESRSTHQQPFFQQQWHLAVGTHKQCWFLKNNSSPSSVPYKKWSDFEPIISIAISLVPKSPKNPIFFWLNNASLRSAGDSLLCFCTACHHQWTGRCGSRCWFFKNILSIFIINK